MLIDDPAKAERLARAILADIRLYSGAEALTPGSAAVAEGRELFRGRVVPALHGVFEAVLAGAPVNPPASVLSGPLASSTDAEPESGNAITIAVGVAFFVLVVGSGVFAYFKFIGPGQERMDAALGAWIAAARAGHAGAPTYAGPTTGEALAVVGASTGHTITSNRAAYTFEGGGNACVQIDFTGPGGVTRVTVAVNEVPPPFHVTHVGLPPACTCGRNGSVKGCR